MFTYYQQVTMEEHMLFASEIGVMYQRSAQYVAQLIRRYCEAQGVAPPMFFYKTKHGLARVYPASIWRPAMDHLHVSR